jgi:enoyl-CoA hydratase/carnithine racemase
LDARVTRESLSSFLSDQLFVEEREHCSVLHLISADGVNRLTCERVAALTATVEQLSAKPLIIVGNEHYFSVGADLNEIAALSAVDTFEFARLGQKLMQAIDDFPAPVYAAISGYCMGGGLDLALACDFRICGANAVFGHRGAALGLITGWGGTQRLPRLIGRSRALQMFVAAEKIGAAAALDIGLVDELVADPLARAIELASRGRNNEDRPDLLP